MPCSYSPFFVRYLLLMILKHRLAPSSFANPSDNCWSSCRCQTIFGDVATQPVYFGDHVVHAPRQCPLVFVEFRDGKIRHAGRPLVAVDLVMVFPHGEDERALGRQFQPVGLDTGAAQFELGGHAGP